MTVVAAEILRWRHGVLEMSDNAIFVGLFVILAILAWRIPHE